MTSSGVEEDDLVWGGTTEKTYGHSEGYTMHVHYSDVVYCYVTLSLLSRDYRVQQLIITDQQCPFIDTHTQEKPQTFN